MPSGAAAGHLRRLWSAEGLALGLGVLQGLVVARVLGPDSYGVFALLLTFVSFVYVILDPRSGDAVIRYVTDFIGRGEPRRAAAMIKLGFVVDTFWSLFSLLVVVAIAGPATSALNIEAHAGLVLVAALGSAVVAPVATSRSVLSVFEEFRLISRVQVGVSIVRALSIITVAVAGFGLGGVVLTVTLVGVLEGILFVVMAVRVARRRVGATLRDSHLRELSGEFRAIRHFLTMSFLTTLASSAVKQADTLILGLVASPREAGYYRLAKSLTAPVSNIATPIQTILYPRLASAEAGGDYAGADALLTRTVRRLCAPLALAALFCLPLVPLVITVVAGEDFAPAAAPALALLVGVAWSLLTLPVRTLFLVRDQVSALLWFTGAVSAVCVIAFWPLGSIAGAAGVAWGRTGTVMIGTIAMVGYLRRTRRHRASRRVDIARSRALVEDPI